MFGHQKLIVYQRSLEFMEFVLPIINQIPSGHTDLLAQFKRAVTSISLNIAEGAGKTAIRDKKRFYAIARGSTYECAAIMDVLIQWKFVSEESLKPARDKLHEVAAMLSKMIMN